MGDPLKVGIIRGQSSNPLSRHHRENEGVIGQHPELPLELLALRDILLSHLCNLDSQLGHGFYSPVALIEDLHFLWVRLQKLDRPFWDKMKFRDRLEDHEAM